MSSNYLVGQPTKRYTRCGVLFVPGCTFLRGVFLNVSQVPARVYVYWGVYFRRELRSLPGCALISACALIRVGIVDQVES